MNAPSADTQPSTAALIAIDRRVAAPSPGKVGPAAEALPALLGAMAASADGGFRAFAAEAIARLSPEASRGRAA